MLGRVALCFAVASIAAAITGPAHAACADTVGKLMSRDTEKLTTRYNRVSQRLEKGRSSASLVAESCRIARALEPKLSEQIAALKQSGCSKDPDVGVMVADIVRGHEDDLASMRKKTQSVCR